MENQNLETFLKIVELTRVFNEVRRVVVVDAGRVETDSEHSFQVALCSWFVAEQIQAQVDLKKVILFS